MANKFKLGDVVVLKSGGPPMTVAGLPSPLRRVNEDHYHCVWFKGSTKDNGFFLPYILELYSPPNKK
jgi:uncharacterized protein YodC (DUF2158 family)